MRNFWLVAKHEYRSVVARRGFVLLTAAIPLGLVAIVGLTILVQQGNQTSLALGYVDQAGILDAGRRAALPESDRQIELVAFPDAQTAQVALESQQIQAFFVLPPEYPQSLRTDLYYLTKAPSNDVWTEFDDFVRVSLVASYPAQVQQRLLQGSDVTVHDIASNRNFNENDAINIILPFVAVFFFFFATMSAAGYMLGVVASEKESRTMEIMVTSIMPGQLIGGKTAGLLAASLTQLGVYVVAGVVGLRLAAPYVPELQQAVVPWGYLGLTALFFLPAYALISAIMVSIGSAVTELQQGQQVAGLLNLLFVVPLFLIPLILQNSGHSIVLFLTLFPTTSLLTISLRWALGTVPLWQLAASWLLLVGTASFMVWAAARIFRVGMLRYGQPLTFKAVLAAVRGTVGG
jgi:ABC-2 type transport system permease protein